MSQTLIITRGLPGSGKTHTAREWVAAEPLRARVNRDDLRKMTLNIEGFGTYEQEQRITEIQEASVRALLAAQHDVVIDDMHLRRRYGVRWADLALELGIDFDVWDFDTDVEVCVARQHDRMRVGERFVEPEKVREMARRFPAARWPEITPSERATSQIWTPYHPPKESALLGPTQQIYLVDIDGTVAKKRQGPGERGWHEYDRVGEDLPNRGVIRMVNDLVLAGRRVIFMSGRKDYCREHTRAWLREHVGLWTVAAPLYMRADDDNRSDDIVKHELFHQYIDGRYHVRGVIDDRDRVVAMWRAIGLTVAQIDYGNF